MVFIVLIIGVGIFSYRILQLYFPSENNRELKEICRKGYLTQGDINEARNLLSRGADPNQSNFHLSPSLLQRVLTAYLYKNDRVYCDELVSLLLENGADPNEQQSEVGSFLHLAVGHPDTEKILLSYGARVSSSIYMGSNILNLAQSNYNRHKKCSSLEEVELLQKALDKEK